MMEQVQEILQTLFSALSLLVSYFVEEHLPEGKYDNPSMRFAIETKSTPKANVISERDFAKLDCLLRKKPNATTLSLEGMILFANNQVSQWLDSKSIEPEKLVFLLQNLSSSTSYEDLEELSNILQAKQMQLERVRQKKLKKTLWHCENIDYGSLENRLMRN